VCLSARDGDCVLWSEVTVLMLYRSVALLASAARQMVLYMRAIVGETAAARHHYTANSSSILQSLPGHSASL